MKTILRLSSLLVVFALLISGCCTTQTDRYSTKIYTPVYQDLDEVRENISVGGPRELENPGKIYVYDDYLFINERGEGIHVIDNSNPSSPTFVSFLAIPGNGDIAVRDNILYADSYIDLLAFDITNPTSAYLVKRLEGIFPNPLDLEGGYIDPDGRLLVEWKAKDTVVTYTFNDCDDYNPVYYREMDAGGGVSTNEGGGGSKADVGGQSGKGGSMARFTLYSDYLYVVDRTNLQTIDVSNPRDPAAWAKINIGWNIETIFPYKDKLFIGSMTGMFIYDNSTPWNPTFLSEFRHARACDPVVANDKYAYVTLRTGTRCAGNQNQLDIIDISDLMNPELIKSYPMQGPLGLGLEGTTLYICDGNAGLKVFDVNDPNDIELLNWQREIDTYDIIPLGAYAIMIGNDGLYQYDCRDPKNIILLSRIPVK